MNCNCHNNNNNYTNQLEDRMPAIEIPLRQQYKLATIKTLLRNAKWNSELTRHEAQEIAHFINIFVDTLVKDDELSLKKEFDKVK